MSLNLNDVTNFFQQLESFSGHTNKTGVLNQTEAEDAYKKMLAQAGDTIPQAIKDKFKDGGLNSDAFNSIDPFGRKDGQINDQELYKSLNSDTHFKPFQGPRSFGKNMADAAGYAVYRDDAHTNLNSKETAKTEIADIEGILGSATDGGQPDGQLSSEELDHAITLTQANKGTISNADAKLNVMEHMRDNFRNKYDNADGSVATGMITQDSLAREIQVHRSSIGEMAS